MRFPGRKRLPKLSDCRRLTACGPSRTVFADGAMLTIVEGLADGDTLSAEQEAFIETNAFQCGFCTPGFILMIKQLLDENPQPSDDDIRYYLSGNLCRCGACPEIIKAVKLAADKRSKA